MTIPIVMMIDITVGPISITVDATGENEVLHHITAPEFAAKVMDLANYVGPVDDPPQLLDQPADTYKVGELTVHQPELAFEDEGEVDIEDEFDNDGGPEAEMPTGERVVAPFRPKKDKTLARFLETE